MFGGMAKVLAEGIGAADNCSVVFGKEAIIAVLHALVMYRASYN